MIRQTWLDERLFGWTRSGRTGTAWAGSGSNPPSGQDSPETSDDEDTGDYDDIVGLLRTYEGPSQDSRLRSGRSSYADLKQLRAAEWLKIDKRVAIAGRNNEIGLA